VQIVFKQQLQIRLFANTRRVYALNARIRAIKGASREKNPAYYNSVERFRLFHRVAIRRVYDWCPPAAVGVGLVDDRSAAGLVTR
jgi:hypothetical protein